MKPLITLLLGLATICAVATPAFAQKDKAKTPKWRIDPYTRNDPELLDKLGYVSYGPFEFGQRGKKPVTTTDIDEHLHYAQIIWVETAHFRIGSTLESWIVPMDAELKKSMRAELERLTERGLPKVNAKSRKIDPWLRLHLYAQRLEDFYARYSALLGVTDETFPANDKARFEWRGEYAGEGLYLGQKDKYLLLLFQQDTTYQDYMANFTGRRPVGAQAWNYKVVDSLLFSCAAESSEEGGRLQNDLALHAAVIHGTTHLLTNGYLHYSYDLPVWITEGLAHYFERQVTPMFNSFTRSEGAVPIKARKWRWDLETRKLLKNGKYTPLSDVYKWRDFGQIDFDDQVMIWSRWDYLMTLGDDKFALFMKKAKGQVDGTTGTVSSDLVAGTRDAMKEAYGLSPLTLDERWKSWVQENYATK